MMSTLPESTQSPSPHFLPFLDLRQLSTSSAKARPSPMLMRFGSESSPLVPVPSLSIASKTLSFFICYQLVGSPFPSSGKFMTGCALSIVGLAPKVTVVAGLHRFGRQCWFVRLFGAWILRIVWFPAFLSYSSERVRSISFWFDWVWLRDCRCWGSFWFSWQIFRWFLRLFIWGWVAFTSWCFLWSFSKIKVCNNYEL